MNKYKNVILNIIVSQIILLTIISFVTLKPPLILSDMYSESNRVFYVFMSIVIVLILSTKRKEDE